MIVPQASKEAYKDAMFFNTLDLQLKWDCRFFEIYDNDDVLTDFIPANIVIKPISGYITIWSDTGNFALAAKDAFALAAMPEEDPDVDASSSDTCDEVFPRFPFGGSDLQLVKSCGPQQYVVRRNYKKPNDEMKE